MWLMAATLLRLPVSATHSIVGATVGFALVAHGAAGIKWAKLGLISKLTILSQFIMLFFTTFRNNKHLQKAETLEITKAWNVFHEFNLNSMFCMDQ